MSRYEAQNEQFLVAFGADHICGSFIQVWKKPVDQQDTYILGIDNMGVSFGEDGAAGIPQPARLFVEDLQRRFKFARSSQGNLHPNIDSESIQRLASGFGVKISLQDIYRALD